MRSTLFTLLALLLVGGGLLAQTPDAAIVTDIVATPNYFVTVLLGVMLAIGFQFLLTSLSIAIGLTATPNLKDSYVAAKYGPNSSNNDNTEWHETNDSSHTGVLITTGLGVWNVITAGLSLFAATALALTLTPIVNAPIAMTLGLSIWAVFYMLMFYLEGRMVGTLIGSLIGTAVSGLRAGGEAVKQLFTPSPASQIQSVADNTIDKLRQEVTATLDTDQLNATLDKYLDRATSELPSYDRLKKDLQDIVKSGSSSGNPATWTAIQGVINKTIDETGNNDDPSKRSKTERLRALLNDLQDEVNQQNSGNSRVSRLSAPGTGRQGGSDNPQYIQQVTDWLQSATPESFDAEQLSQQLQSFARDPKGSVDSAREQFSQLDRDTVVSAISKNTSLQREQVEEYADRAFSVLNTIKNKLSTEGSSSGAPQGVDDLLKRAEASLKSFVDSTDDPRLNYDSLKDDLVRAFNNPNEALDIVKARLNNYDRNTVISVLTNNRRVNRSDINRIADQVDSAQATVKDQLQAIEDGARSAAKNVERRLVIQSEGARKAAISAAWWLFTAILVSGAAAIAGSQVGAF